MKRTISYNFAARTIPLPHQVEAINYIQHHTYTALFDEQGLGKTKAVIEGLSNNFREGLIDGGLIICKKNLISNWQEEIQTHSYLKSIVLKGTSKERGQKFMGFTHFYIINYEGVKGEIERLKLFLKVRRIAIVLDESHTIKNPKSQVSRAVVILSTLAVKRVIISGTPVANKPEDLWAQFFFLDQGKLLGDDFLKFKRRFRINIHQDPEIAEEALKSLRLLIKENSIRRKKGDVLELPEKTFFDTPIELSSKQSQIYHAIRDELRLEIKNISGEIVLDDSSELLKKLLRLCQAASNPRLFDKSYDEQPAKFRALKDLIEKILSKKEKVIVWTSFIGNIKLLKNDLKDYGICEVYGDLPIAVRVRNIEKFKTDSTCRVLVANPAAAREGLTLTVANNAIYLDRNFNLVDYLQSQDRIHRISQSKPCSIFKFIARGTIDEYIDEIISRKDYLAAFVEGDRSKPMGIRMTKEQLLTYLGTRHDRKQN